MARIKLTASRVRDFDCPPDKGQAFLWDSEVPGLAVRGTAGRKSFIYQARFDGRDIRLTIGDVNAWQIESGDPEWPGAREQARKLQNLIDLGIDPRQQKAEKLAEAKAKRREAARKNVMVGEAWRAYVAARSHKWGESHKRDHDKAVAPGGEKVTRGRRKRDDGLTLPGMIHPLLPLRLSELTPARVKSWMDDCNARGRTEAAKNYRLLRAFVRWCAEQDDYAAVTDLRAVQARSVRDEVKPVASKGDALQREQVKPWFAAVATITNPVHRAYLHGLLLTGARREELAGLRWADVDFQWRALTIRDKVEGERIIPLTPYVAGLLAALPRRNAWVFSTPHKSAEGRISPPLAAMQTALVAAGLPKLSLHDLRRSFGTLAEWCEVPVGVVAQIMGHKPSALAEKHYRRRPLDLLRMWHVRIEAFILEQAGIERPAADTAPGALRVVGQ